MAVIRVFWSPMDIGLATRLETSLLGGQLFVDPAMDLRDLTGTKTVVSSSGIAQISRSSLAA